MVYLIKILGGSVIAGACFWGGADLYKLLKTSIAGPGKDATPRRDAERVLSEGGSTEEARREQP